MSEQEQASIRGEAADDTWRSLSVPLSRDGSRLSVLNLAFFSDRSTRQHALDTLRLLMADDIEGTVEEINRHLERLSNRAFVELALFLVDVDPIAFGAVIIDGSCHFIKTERDFSVPVTKIARALGQCSESHKQSHDTLLASYLTIIEFDCPFSRLLCENLALALDNRRVRQFLCGVALNHLEEDVATYLRDIAKSVLVSGRRYADVSDYLAEQIISKNVNLECKDAQPLLSYLYSGPITAIVADALVYALRSPSSGSVAAKRLLDNSSNTHVIDSLMRGLCSDDSRQIDPVLRVLEQSKDTPIIRSALYQVALQRYWPTKSRSPDSAAAAIAASYAAMLCAGEW
jgi:hypothetical protein